MDQMELLRELDPILDLGVVNVAGDSTVEMTPNRELFLNSGGSAYHLQEQARQSFLKRVSIPVGIVNRLSPTTATQVLDELHRGRGLATAVIQEGSGAMLGFAPQGEYQALPVPDVLEGIERALGTDVEYHRAHVLPNWDVRLEVVGATETAVKVGDLVRSGVAVQFSPIGITNPQVQAYALRLACTNGMTATTVLEQFALNQEEDQNPVEVRNWLRDVVAQAYASVPKASEQWAQLAEEPITAAERPLYLGALAREARLQGPGAAALWARATEEPPETAWDVLNLMTWLSSHALSDPQQIVRAQEVSADWVNQVLHRKHCPTCLRAA